MSVCKCVRMCQWVRVWVIDKKTTVETISLQDDKIVLSRLGTQNQARVVKKRRMKKKKRKQNARAGRYAHRQVF